jgi:diguanylate cyclase (GGDEF)-like protein/PAS domain S-box-containing protein
MRDARADRLAQDSARWSSVDELELARVALDAALDSILVHDCDGNVLYFNESALRLHNCTREEFMALPAWGWTQQPRRIIEQRMAELEASGCSTFISQRRNPERLEAIHEVHARLVNTSRGRIVVSVVHDITERCAAEEMLRDLAFHDHLTGVANRALLDDRIAVAIADARRRGELLGLIYLDIDEFKPVNDRYGHDCGDEVLRIVAKRLSHSVRETDTVARVGGDEFVVVLPRVGTRQSLDETARKLADAVSRPIEAGCASITVTVSVGVTSYVPDEDDARSLMMKADLAMYDAKQYRDHISSVEHMGR